MARSEKRRTSGNPMLDLVFGLPAQLLDGARIARKAALGRPTGIDRVIIAGMGGSGIGGNLCRGLLLDRADMPILLCQDYDLPAAATSTSLFLAVSYSGNTEETLSAYTQAVRRRCRIVAVTTGGELERRAIRDGCPVLRLPTGMPPRAALGYLFAVQLTVLERMGVCRSQGRGMVEAVRLMKRRQKPWLVRARRIARHLAGRLPMVYSTSRMLDAVADRWRCQLNENAGVLCHTSVLPEHNHNEIVGMGRPEAPGCHNVIVALLDRETHPRTRYRLESVLNITRQSYDLAVDVESEGRPRLARVLSLVMLGDLVSVALARELGKDPMEIARIDALKRLMSGRKAN